MQKKIALFVTSVHLLMICFLLFSPVKKTPPIKKHIAVRTIQPKTRAPAVAARPPKKPVSSHAASPQPPSATPKPTVKKESAKTAPPKTKASKPAASSKPAPVTSKPIPPQKKPAMVEKGKAKKSPPAPKRPPERPPQQVLKEIDEALAKIDEKVYSKPQSKLNVPQIKGSSASQIPFPDFEEMFDEAGTDTDVLQAFFGETLKLPENGEVRTQLTIKRDGTVVQLVVLEAQSQKNKAYLEKNIPLLKLPVHYDKETTIIFTFCNAR